MSRHYLFGPVRPAFAEQNLFQAPAERRLSLLRFRGGSRYPHGIPGDDWNALRKRLPPRWQADCLVLYLAYTTIPPGLWAVPIPIVGLAADWNWQWHHHRRCLPRCPVVLTDTSGVTSLAQAGSCMLDVANLYGCERDFLIPTRWPGGRRAVSRAISTSSSSATSTTPFMRERVAVAGPAGAAGPPLERADRHGVFGENYRALLRRARIVFNHSLRGECNRRAFEAPAGRGPAVPGNRNREVLSFFENGKECVFYTDDNLETLLEYYLTHEDERRALAEAGHRRVQEYGFPALWSRALAQIDAEWDRLVEPPGDERCPIPWRSC